MMHCPHCGSTACVKNGTHQGYQRYRCKDCQYNYTPKPKPPPKPDKKSFALLLYLSGMPIRTIASAVNTSPTTVQRWIAVAVPLLNQAGLFREKHSRGSSSDAQHLSEYLARNKAHLGYGVAIIQNTQIQSGPKTILLLPESRHFS
ncbi:MAG: hypothetical protein B7X06_00915 [Verrucomicrobia bacterium 21-51-4]|nr:MAG: hypothetical protein B7X06_00915 [Verrucomicrobia bacterium 21-51-4]HQU08881.1 hypothetical protein [Opitutales bacterium]